MKCEKLRSSIWLWILPFVSVMLSLSMNSPVRLCDSWEVQQTAIRNVDFSEQNSSQSLLHLQEMRNPQYPHDYYHSANAANGDGNVPEAQSNGQPDCQIELDMDKAIDSNLSDAESTGLEIILSLLAFMSIFIIVKFGQGATKWRRIAAVVIGLNIIIVLGFWGIYNSFKTNLATDYQKYNLCRDNSKNQNPSLIIN